MESKCYTTIACSSSSHVSATLAGGSRAPQYAHPLLVTPAYPQMSLLSSSDITFRAELGATSLSLGD